MTSCDDSDDLQGEPAADLLPLGFQSLQKALALVLCHGPNSLSLFGMRMRVVDSKGLRLDLRPNAEMARFTIRHRWACNSRYIT